MPFLQSAIRGCGKRGILAVTATDTAPLAGAHAAKCRRRYQCEPVRGFMCHEGGLRILMCNVARELAKFDRGMRPLLSFYADHYFRTYIQITEGAKAADDSLAMLGYMRYDMDTMERSTSRLPDDNHRLGPFWLGPLHDPYTLSRMSPEGMTDERLCSRYLDLWREELDDQVFVYNIAEFSSRLKMSQPRIDDFVAFLNAHGRASRSHVSPTSFKTDIFLDDLCRFYREFSPDTERMNYDLFRNT